MSYTDSIAACLLVNRNYRDFQDDNAMLILDHRCVDRYSTSSTVVS